MKTIIQKLTAVCEAWKEQACGSSCRLAFPGGPLEPPLQWTIDASGMLCLDDVWICPVHQIDETDFEDALASITPVSFELTLKDGLLTIIIIKDYDEYRIAGIERAICHRISPGAEVTPMYSE